MIEIEPQHNFSSPPKRRIENYLRPNDVSSLMERDLFSISQMRMLADMISVLRANPDKEADPMAQGNAIYWVSAYLSDGFIDHTVNIVDCTNENGVIYFKYVETFRNYTFLLEGENLAGVCAERVDVDEEWGTEKWRVSHTELLKVLVTARVPCANPVSRDLSSMEAIRLEMAIATGQTDDY